MHRGLAVPMPIFRSRATLSERFRQVVAFPPKLLGYSSWNMSYVRDVLRRRVTLTAFSSQPLGQPEKAMGVESQIELWSPNLTTFCFVGFGTDRLRRQEAMKTAGRETPKHRSTVLREHMARVSQNRSRSLIISGLRSKKTSSRRRC